MTATKKHMVMRFEMNGITRAYQFVDCLKALGLAGSVEPINGKWFVKTDTRCLPHAAELTKFVYGGAR